MTRLLLPLFALLVALPSHAEPTYGAEFEFYHKEFEWGNDDCRGPVAEAAKKKFVANVTARCKTLGCTVEKVSGKWSPDFKVTFADGWWFKISHDPAVIEITTKPSTIAELSARRELIDDAIFKTAKKDGFYTDMENTAHFNIGAKSAFGNKAIDLMRFFVDYQNHPELALGALGDDLGNAPPLSVLGADQRQVLLDVINDVETGKIKGVGEVAEAITRRVYTRSYYPEWGGANHYQAVGLKYVKAADLANGDRPLELRSMWSQPNMGHFIRIAELVEARIAMLNKQEGLIYYDRSAREEIRSWSELKTRFYVYVRETGLQFEPYQRLLPKEAQQADLADFTNESLSIEKRLKSLEAYKDILNNSEWFREYAHQLIRQGHAQGYHGSDRLLSKIVEGQKRAAPMCSRILL